jgi:hypothetical protein
MNREREREWTEKGERTWNSTLGLILEVEYDGGGYEVM